MQDPFGGRTRDDPYPSYRLLRETEPVHESSLGLTAYLRHADCAAILRDGKWGRAAGEQRLRGAQSRGYRRSFLRQDPPEHTRLRALVGKAFSPQVVQDMRPRIEALVAGLLDEVLQRRQVDLVGEYAYPIPVAVICELLGVPADDRVLFASLAAALSRGQDPDQVLSPQDIRRRNGAVRDLREYFTGLLEDRRGQPDRGDLLARLLAVRDGGDELSQEDLLATCVLLLFAGHETTAGLIANGVHALLRHPDQAAHLRSGLVQHDSSWVDELLRYDAPIQFVSRTARENLEYGGRSYVAGESVLLVLAAANRDPEAYQEPDTLDLGRRASRNLGFGLGIHFCLGAQLARLEVEIAIRSLLDRAPQLRLTDEPASYKPNLVIRGLARLPVRTH